MAIESQEDAKRLAKILQDNPDMEGYSDLMSQLRDWDRSQQADAPSISPIQLEEGPGIMERAQTSRMGGPFAPTKSIYTPEEKKMAAEGVEFREGIQDFGLRTKLSFAINDAAKLKFASEELDTPVRQYMDELQWWNPDSGRWQSFDEHGFTFYDVADIAGPSIPAAGALVGEVTGAFFGGGWGAIPGAAAGAGVGELARVQAGQAMGVNPIGDEQVWSEVWPVAVMEGALAWGSRGVTGAARLFDVAFHPKPSFLDPEKAKRVLDSIKQEDMKLLAEIQAWAGKELKPLTGQLANDEEYLAAVQQLATHVELSVQINERLNRNDDALMAAFRAINEGPIPDTRAGREQMAEAMEEEIQKGLRGRERLLHERQKVVEQVEGLLEIAGQSPEEAGKAMRKQLTEILEEYQKEIDALYDGPDGIKAMYGLKPRKALSDVKVTVKPGDPFYKFWHTLDAEQRQALVLEVESGKQRLAKGNISDAMDFDPSEGQGYTVLDLHQIEVALRHHRAYLRGRTDPDAPQNNDRRRFVRALQEQRNQYLADKNPELLELIEQAEDKVKVKNNLFDRGALGTIFKEDIDGYVLNDKAVFAHVVEDRSGDSMEHFVRLVGGDPNATHAARRGFYALYLSEVKDEAKGYLSDTKHYSFIKRYDNVGKALFGKEWNDNIRHFGRFARSMKRSAKRLAEYQRDIKKTWKKVGLEPISSRPDTLVKDLLTLKGFSTDDVVSFMGAARRAGVADEVRAAAATFVYEKALGSGRTLTSNAIENMLRGGTVEESAKKGYADRIITILGEEWRDNMFKLKRALEIAERQSRTGGVTEPVEGVMGKLARAFVTPPLSKRGRLQTAVLFARREAADRVFYQALTDPKMLKALVAADAAKQSAKREFEMLSAFGGAYLAVDYNVEDIDYIVDEAGRRIGID